MGLGYAPRHHQPQIGAAQSGAAAPPIVASAADAGAAAQAPAADSSALPPIDALANLCQVLLSSNEFLYVD